MASRPTARLPDKWIRRSEEWGRQVVADYAAGRNERSRAVQCFDAASNVGLQQKAKMAECAFAFMVGLDPEKVVHWERWCDNGSDVFWADQKWDVKATAWGNKYLIWPIAKNELFKIKKFDQLVLIGCACPDFEMVGYVSKEVFGNQHHVAPESHALFPGTWYMADDELRDGWPLVDFFVGLPA